MGQSTFIQMVLRNILFSNISCFNKGNLIVKKFLQLFAYMITTYLSRIPVRPASSVFLRI